jgi:DNA-binding XRE family transcriptional regulator
LTVVNVKDYPFGMSIPWDRLNFARDVTAEAKEILQIREQLGLTQQQMATILDVSTATYYRWESGRGLAWFCAIELMRVWAREDTVATADGHGHGSLGEIQTHRARPTRTDAPGNGRQKKKKTAKAAAERERPRR